MNPSGTNALISTVPAVGAGQWAVRINVYFTVLPNINMDIPGVFTGFGLGAARFNASDNKIYAYADSGGFGASGVSVTANVLYCIDLKADFTVNPHLINVRVNGSACGQASEARAIDSTGGWIAIGSGNAHTATYRVDDVLICTDLTDYPIGPGFVNHFIPTADGTHNISGTGDFQRGNTGVDILNATTTAWQLIDDVPLPSGAVDQADNQRGVAPATPATDYVECIFGPAPGINAPTRPPRAVEAILAYHQISTTTGQSTVRLNDNGTTNDILNTGAAAGVTTYRYARKQYATAVAGGGPWVIGGGGNGDFTDLRCRFLAQDANPDQCFDSIMIEAEFPEPLLLGRPFGIRGQNLMNQLLVQ